MTFFIFGTYYGFVHEVHEVTQTQSIMRAVNSQNILINNNKHQYISLIYYPYVFKINAV